MSYLLKQARTVTLTPVLFRVWKPRPEHGEEGGDVLALFPDDPGTNDPYTCSSYEHVGQHGSADPWGCLKATRPATPAEYRPLMRELQAKPYAYRLRVLKRCNHSYYLDSRRRRIAEQRDLAEAEANASYLWLRVGDAGEYTNYGDDFSALADDLYDHRIEADDIDWLTCPRDPEKHANPYLPAAGFRTGVYDGQNYVSLFWGDAEGNLKQPLTKAEQGEVTRRLRKLEAENKADRFVADEHAAEERIALGGNP